MKESLAIMLFVLCFQTLFSQSEKHDTLLIREAAMNYIEGAYSGNADRMAEAIHPELQKVYCVTLPNSDSQAIRYSNYSLLIEGTRTGMGKVPESRRNIDYKLLHWDRDIATVRITSVMYQDYCHIVKINGKWKIINVLWRLNR